MGLNGSVTIRTDTFSDTRSFSKKSIPKSEISGVFTTLVGDG